jgi:hypothetical protein
MSLKDNLIEIQVKAEGQMKRDQEKYFLVFPVRN